MYPENIRKTSEFVWSMQDGELPHEVLDTAKKCLVDWCGVALGAHQEQTAITIKQVIGSWQSQGKAQILLGRTAASSAAALINGTLAHSLDFDDTNIDSLSHLSAPTWAAVLALGGEGKASELQMLKAFVAGYEVGARFGGSGFGAAVDHHGWHSTGVFGCLAAAAGSCSILGVKKTGIPHALGAAATQVSGLTASFGTMSKPFHAGKAAFNGVLGAQLAESGFIARADLLEPDGGLAKTLVQNSPNSINRVDFGGDWELLRNSFKPYACCLLIHAAVDAAKSVHGKILDNQVVRIDARVNPLAVQLAGTENPITPLGGKFSLAFCIALAFRGHILSEADFSELHLIDPLVQRISSKVFLVADERIEKTAAELSFHCADGSVISVRTDNATGTPQNPMTWENIRLKFFSLVEPVLGDRTAALFSVLKDFEHSGQYQQFAKFVYRN